MSVSLSLSSHSGRAVLPVLRLCQLYSQHQRVPVVWRQEVHLCYQQLHICEWSSRRRQSTSGLVFSSGLLLANNYTFLWILWAEDIGPLSMLHHRTNRTMFFLLCIITDKWKDKFLASVNRPPVSSILSSLVIEREELHGVSGAERAVVQQAGQLQELLAESQLSVGPEPARVSCFAW